MTDINPDKKLAVVLFNIGGPLKESDIEPYLFNFFMDPNIIGAPGLIRYFIARYISKTRGQGPARDAYRALGGASPLLKNTQAQGQALEDLLRKTHPQTRVFVSMRYWHPFVSETLRDVSGFMPDQVALVPLYPQFSTTTSFSSLQNWARAAGRANFSVPAFEVGCYYDSEGFIDASADHIAQALDQAPPNTRLLFSAHGLPERVVAGGDPYQWQCEQTAAAIARRLNRPHVDWQMCYQSRVGPLKWIGPSTDEALEKAARNGVGVVIYPLAFVSEHVETLVEIDQEYRHRAQELGIPYFGKAATVGTHPAFIQGLRDVIVHKGARSVFCPRSFTRCHCRRLQP